MKVKHRFGDLDLKDYLTVVSAPGTWKRTKALLVSGAVVFAFAAGRFGPWSGRNTDQMSLTEAIELADRAPEVDWEHETAVRVLAEHIGTAIGHLSRVACRQDPNSGTASRYAVLALRHSAVDSIRSLMDAQGNGVDARPALDIVRQTLEGR